MRKVITKALVVVASTGLLLAACSDPTTSTPGTETTDTTNTAAATNSEVASTAASTEDSSQAPGASDQADTPTPSEDLPAIEDGFPPDIGVGSRVTIADIPVHVCVYGDGWGLNIMAGNDHTSCEFVTAVGDALIEPIRDQLANVRDVLQPTVTVTSPVTGQPYEMHCFEQGRAVVCRGGDNAEVVLY